MTRAERGWLAGILDGEGSITAWTYPRAGSQTERLNQAVLFYNKDPRIIQKVRLLIEEITGDQARIGQYGTKIRGYTKGVAINRPQHIVAVLTKLLPDLVGKRDQAIVLLAHLQWRATQMRMQRNGKYDVEVYRRDRETEGRIKALNRQFRARTDYTEATAQGGEEIVGSPGEPGSAPKSG